MSEKSLFRALYSIISLEEQNKSIQEPMVWISGPRQVGKTTLVKQLSESYFNWDTAEVKKAYLHDPYFFRGNVQWVIFDEIHKFRNWKKILKGYYDSPSRKENFIVTGSGKMDLFQKGGDSLQGRYNLFHLTPLLYDEIYNSKQKKLSKPRDFESWEPDGNSESDYDLRALGGFPAPFLKGKVESLRKWQDQYLERVVREEVRDFSAVQRLDQIELLARLLPTRVSSPLSIKSLSEDLDSSTVGVKSWIRLFEILYFGFQIKPYHKKIHRAVKKEQKWYFYQWTYVEDEGPKFENYLATQLSSICLFWKEQGFGRYELYYLRDQDKREIDFLITKDLKPIALIEAKNSAQNWPASLYYYTQKLNIPGFLVYPEGPVKRVDQSTSMSGWSLPSHRFLKGLILM